MRTLAQSRRAILTWVGLFLLALVVTLQLHADFLHPDGTFYFVQLRSFYFDRDIDFRNEAGGYPWIRQSTGTVLPNGLLANPFPLGSAILWSPFYAVADAVCHVQQSGICRGYSRVYIRAITVSTVFWATLGCLLTASSIRRLGGRSDMGWLAAVVMFTASPLAFYVVLQADYSHGVSFFAGSLLLYATVRAQEQQRTHSACFVCGLTVGLAFLVRWQDLVLGLVPLACAVSGGSLRSKLSRAALLLGGAFIVAIPQFLFWAALYGKPFTVPQGTGFISLRHVEVLPFLFSTWNGVFIWHPVLVVALAGLLVPWRFFHGSSPDDLPRLRRSCLAAIAIEMALSMMVEDWWSSGSFGQRRLVSVLPLFTLGMYQVLALSVRCGRGATGLVAAGLVIFIAWNALTMYRYYEGKLPLNPVHAQSYPSGDPYQYYDHVRRATDILLGRQP